MQSRYTPYPQWDPQPNPVPFIEPGWNLGQVALGVSSWAEITLELIRRLTAPGAPDSLTRHYVMEPQAPALRFQRPFLLHVIRQLSELEHGKPPSDYASTKTYDRWLRRSKDYGLERLDLYDADHPRQQGWYALDLRGAYDALWAILGVPHPLETELPPYGGRGLGEAREFELLEAGKDRLTAAYPELATALPEGEPDTPERRTFERGQRAFEQQLERHSDFYATEGSANEDLLPPERPLRDGQYARHYSIFPSTQQRVRAMDALREAKAVRSKTGCPACGGQRRASGFSHTPTCVARPIPLSTATGKRHDAAADAPPPSRTRPDLPDSCPSCHGRRTAQGYHHAQDCIALKVRFATKRTAKLASKARAAI